MSKDCIVVTGASRGIGAAIAATLASNGHDVLCLSRSAALPQVEGVSREARARWIAGSCDVTNPDSVHAAIDSAVQQGIRIVGLVNNAGVHLEGKSQDVPLKDWHQVIDTNATSVLVVCQAVYPHLLKSKGGLIINIGSFFDKLGVKRNLAYCASKAAVGAMTRCLAVEWARDRIKVIDVAPGYILTDLNREMMSGGPLRAYLEKRIPAGEPGTAADVAELVGLLFSTTGAFLTGETIYIDGAQGVAH